MCRRMSGGHAPALAAALRSARSPADLRTASTSTPSSSSKGRSHRGRRRLDDRLDAMVARDVGRVHGPHRRPARSGGHGLLVEALAPAGAHSSKAEGSAKRLRTRIIFLWTRRLRRSTAEGECEVGAICAIACRRSRPSAASPSCSVKQAELAPQPCFVGFFKGGPVGIERLFRVGHGHVRPSKEAAEGTPPAA